jgi:hypothetical protein
MIKFFGCLLLCISLGVVAGHLGGYAIIFLDEYEVNRAIR